MIINFIERTTRLVFSASRNQHLVLLILLGCCFYFPFIGSIHLFDWDEINFAEISREMYVTGDYFKVQVDYQPFYEKPPLFSWLQNLSFEIWGINEWAARFPNAVIGICCLLMLYIIGSRLINKSFGLLWSLCYTGSLLPFFFFKTGLIDPTFNITIFASLCYLIYAIQRKQQKLLDFTVAGLITGIAILTKGPVALLIVVLTVLCYWIIFFRKIRLLSFKQILSFGLGTLLISAFWFIPETISRGPSFIIEFIHYMVGLLSTDVASHAQPFYYHFIVIFFGCFPISIFGIPNLIKTNAKIKGNFNGWMVCLFWVVLLLFSLVKTKIINYSSLTYYPLSFLAAYTLYSYQKNEVVKQSWSFLIIGLTLCIPIILIPILFHNKVLVSSIFAHDSFLSISMESFQLNFNHALIGCIWLISIVVAFIFFRRKNVTSAVVIHTLGLAIFLNAVLFTIIPKIEQVLQGPSIEYFEALAGKDVYVGTQGFKSYGKLFYTKRKPGLSGYSDNDLFTGYTDKNTYMVVKPRKLKKMAEYPEFKLIQQKGGFYLFFRQKKD